MKIEIILLGLLLLLIGCTSEPYVETTLNETEELMFDESVITQCAVYSCPESEYDYNKHKFLWFEW